MKKYKELEIGRDGVSRFVEVEAGPYGQDGIAGAARHRHFCSIRKIKVKNLGKIFYIVVNGHNTINPFNKDPRKGFTKADDAELFNENASKLAERNIFGNAYVVKFDNGTYRALYDEDIRELKKVYPFPIKGDDEEPK